LQTIEENLTEIKTEQIIKGIELEYLKEERFFSNLTVKIGQTL
jgi:hypothetical protein